MYKISWGKKSDKYHRTFLIVPDVHALFDVYFVVTGYGRNDGCTPVDVTVTNLDGHEIDMTNGLAEAASSGTYAARSA
jgi:hypothetical protein